MRKISLKRNFVLTLIGNFAYGFAQWGMLMVIAKLGTPEMVGRFALGLAVTAPVMMFSQLNLRAVLATDASGKYRFGEYLSLRLAMMAAALAFIVVSSFVAGYDREFAAIAFVIGLAKAFEAVSDLFFGLMQQHERMELIAQSLIVKATLSLALFAAGMLATRSLLWSSVLLMVSWLLTLAFDVWNAGRALGPSGDRAVALADFLPVWAFPRLKTLARLSLPLGFASLLISLLVNIPRYFVGGMLGERELGIFAAMAYAMVVGARVVTALGESAVPRLAKLHQAGDAAGYRSLLLKTVAFGALIGLGGVGVAAFLGRPILTLLYKPEYAERIDVFVWLMFGAGLGYVSLFLQYGLMAAQQFVVQPVVMTAAAAVLSVACLVLVPARGLSGAAMAVAASAATQIVLNAWFTLKAVRALASESRS